MTQSFPIELLYRYKLDLPSDLASFFTVLHHRHTLHLSIIHKCSTSTRSVQSLTMPSTAPSPEGALVRQDIHVLRELLDKEHSQNHMVDVFISRLRESHLVFQRAFNKTIRECEDRCEKWEESLKLFKTANMARNLIMNICAIQHSYVNLLTRSTGFQCEFNAERGKCHDVWAQEFAMIVTISEAAKDLDENLKEFKVKDEKAKKLEVSVEHGRIATAEDRKLIDELSEEHQTLEKEVDDVLSQATQMQK